jgi:hypothetical protein
VSLVEIAQRYFSIEQYRPANRLQLDSRNRVRLKQRLTIRRGGVHIVYRQTLR